MTTPNLVIDDSIDEINALCVSSGAPQEFIEAVNKSLTKIKIANAQLAPVGTTGKVRHLDMTKCLSETMVFLSRYINNGQDVLPLSGFSSVFHDQDMIAHSYMRTNLLSRAAFRVDGMTPSQVLDKAILEMLKAGHIKRIVHGNYKGVLYKINREAFQ